MVTKILILIFILTLSGIFPLHGNNEEHSGWYIEKLGNYKQGKGKNDPRVKRVDDVFQRLKKVADIGESAPTRLFFIADARAAYALTLPDGGIIINSITLDICYGREVPGKRDNRKKSNAGDQRIAFILGHELAHLANRDFGSYKTLLALQEEGDKKTQKELYKFFETSPTYEKGKELAADSKGAMLAAMAGYKIAPLLGGKNSFLRQWVKRVGENPSYPEVEKRVKSVQIQLQAVKEKVRLFKAGILFLQMGKYADGAAAFREFSSFYPAREVFNNIGVCYLNSALDRLFREFGEEYFRFRLSTAIDYSTAPDDFKFRGEGDYLKDKYISKNLNRAEEYFQLAVRRDPNNRACRYNLSALLILKREYAAALAQCNDILKEDEYDVKALNNKIIALYYLGKEEGLHSSKKALTLLQKAHLLEEKNFEVLYNLAALSHESKHSDEVKSLWKKYLNLSNIPRDNYYAFIYNKVNEAGLPSAARGALPPAAPVKIGADYSFKNSRKYKLTSEKSNDTDSWTINLEVGVENDLFVIAIEGYSVLVEQELNRPKSPERLLDRFGPPQKIIRHTAGTFYIYEDRGFSLKEVDGEICSHIWFKKDS